MFFCAHACAAYDNVYMCMNIGICMHACVYVCVHGMFVCIRVQAVHTKLRNLVEQNQDTYDDEAEDGSRYFPM